MSMLARVTALSSAMTFCAASAAAQPSLQSRAPVPRALLHGEEAPLIVRFDREDQLDSLRGLENLGVHVQRVDGRPLSFRNYALVRATPAGRTALRVLPGVREIRRAPPAGIPPLDRSAERLGLEAARGARGTDDRWTGKGVLIADLDSLVDAFHPDFFFADAGWYDWIDVDGDGVFRPRTDAIDLDADGEVDAAEKAYVLRAAPVDLSGHSTDSLSRAEFDPSVDWLYLDSNGNGERDFGEGFDDEDPAFGEPLFVPDDVDGDGVLDPEERVVRLGTSKLRAVYVNVQYGPLLHSHVYQRGVDLSAIPSDITHGIYGYSDTLHASGVIGILVGGVPLTHRRWVGIAPDAEVVDAFELSATETGGLMWALGQSPDVMVHEYVVWTGLELDGSDAYSALIDASPDVAHVCPAGNIGGAGKHTELELAADGSSTISFSVPNAIQQVELSIYARGEGEFIAELIAPDDTVVPLGIEDALHDVGRGQAWTFGEDTARGTQDRHVQTYMAPTGSWRVHLQAQGGSLFVHGMLADEQGFSASTAWLDPVEASTVAAPSTADHCLSVGATPSHVASEDGFYESGDEAFGEVRAYSAVGPRIDGDLRPHVLAPDNPWAPLGHGDLFPSSPGAFIADPGAYMVFGGTSGAGPHAAGVAALLAESGVGGGDALARIRETAVADAIAGALPNDRYGDGRVSAVGALGGEGSAPPSVTLHAMPAHAAPGDDVRLIAEASDPEASAIAFRWDDDYDGTWETGFEAANERSVSFASAGIYRVKVRARDATGRIAEAAVRIVVGARSVDAGVNTPDAGVADGGLAPVGEGGCGCGVAAPSSERIVVSALALLALALLARRRAHRT